LDLGHEGSWVEVYDFFRENGAIIVDSVELETILEWLDVKLLEEGSF
jgi:DNA replication protein DnaD